MKSETVRVTETAEAATQEEEGDVSGGEGCVRPPRTL